MFIRVIFVGRLTFKTGIFMEKFLSLGRFPERFRTRGAIAPSSDRLCVALARLASNADHILELGAGTGAVTRALSKVTGVRSFRAVELQKKLAHDLKLKFPGVQVENCSADVALDRYPLQGSVAVVSSLPFRSLPGSIKSSIVRSVLRFLLASPQSRLIQFTYGFREPFAVSTEFQWKRVKWILANLPPACIWVLTKADAAREDGRPATLI